MKAISAAAAGILVPQDYQMPGDTKGKRKKVRPEDLRSGTLYGQYQLRGSILTIKDASTTASGYMAFGTDMTTIPTSASAGTGIYIDYTGIYGLVSNVKQFYWTSADGKGYAGAGAVTIDANGISIVSPASKSDINSYKFTSGGTTVASWSHYLGTSPDVSTSTLEVNSQTNRDLFSYITTPQPSATYESSIKLDAYTTHIHAIYDDSATPKGYVRIYGGSTFGVVIGDGSTSVPSSTLHLKNTAPSFRMEDSTGSAKSLLVTVDANKAIFKEVGGGDLFAMDLANERIGIGTASPSVNLHVSYATAGTASRFQVEHTDNTNAASHSTNQVKVAGSSGGDPRMIFTVTGVTDWTIGADNSDSDKFKVSNNFGLGTNDFVTIDASGNVVLNNAAIATTATDGFLYVAACAGAPTGVPTAVTGRIPIVVDSTNNKMYIYSGGAWQALN